MRCRIVLILICILAGGDGSSSAGTLVTRDGQTLTGDLSLSEGQFTLKPADGPARRFEMTEVVQATFAQPAAAAATSYPKPRRDKQPTGPVKVLVEYFADAEFKDRRLARFESAISTSWDRKTVREAGIPERAGVRYTARLVPKVSEDVTLTIEAYGPSKLWVNGQLKINETNSKGLNKFSATVPLKANTPAAIRMEVFAGASSFHARLLWNSRSIPLALVPNEAFLPPADAPTMADVAMAAPPDDSNYRNPEAIPLEATVRPPAGLTIARVDFLAGGEVAGTATSAPYRADWKAPPAGHHRIRARATDERGTSSYSDPIEVSIADAGENHSLPAPWGQQTLGKKELRIPGSASFADGCFHITKAGGQITEEDDSPQFVYQPVSGDFQIVARLDSLTPADNQVGPLAGLMIRENMTALDRVFALVVSPQATVVARRTDYWGRITATDRTDSPAAWIKIVRHGNRLRGYTSTDGKAWTLLSAERIEMTERVFVGLCAMARSRETSGVATFDHVSITPGPPAFTYATEGILFRSGTFLAADVAGLKENSVTYTRHGKRTTSSNADVARLIYKPVPAELAEKIPADRTGVALASGDFIEGELKEVSYRVTVSNVVFGPRTFGIKTNDVLAIYLKDADAPSLPYVVTTTDGSVFQSKSIKTGKDAVSIEDPNLGPIELPLNELAQLKVNAATPIVP
jgi:regulation of enolase protein 1 (concanavalin A-like superfamily)